MYLYYNYNYNYNYILFIARLGGKFVPKRKSKPSLRKEIPASEHATSFEDQKGMNVSSAPTVKQHSEKVSQNECHNVVTVSLSMSYG
jgi:hypothetical protein